MPLLQHLIGIFGSKTIRWLLRSVRASFISQLIFLLSAIILMIKIKRFLVLRRLAAMEGDGCAMLFVAL